MITLNTWADLSELLDLIYEVQQAEGLDDTAAFIAACAEMPALLEMDPATAYAPARVVLFDEAGMPVPAVSW